MKRIYNIFLALLCIVVALSFFPWIYSIIFPADSSEPFVAYSPVSESFIMSDKDGDSMHIFEINTHGDTLTSTMTKADRDSLLPQMFFNQLAARKALPDTIAGKPVDIPILKTSQWVFNSLPRDLNKFQPGVYPIMESRPKRIDLEDPIEVFTLDGDIRFINMATNTENELRSSRFSSVFADKGFVCPALNSSANITAKKPYDEGYMLIDAEHQLFHLKMQAGSPYLAKIPMPKDCTPVYAFIMENPDKQLLGLVADADGSLYAVEREGYRPVKLPIGNIDPSSQRIMIMKNLFNWVIRITDDSGSRWVAIDSDNYSLLGEYRKVRQQTDAEKVAYWIFPCCISFTDISDCYAYPRVSDFSLPATLIWIAIFLIFILINNKKSKK